MSSDKEEPVPGMPGARTQRESFEAHREAEKLNDPDLLEYLELAATETANQFHSGNVYFCIAHLGRNTGSTAALPLLIGAARKEKRNFAKVMLIDNINRMDIPAELHDQVLELSHEWILHKHWHVRCEAYGLVRKLADPRSVPLLLEELDKATDKFQIGYILNAISSTGSYALLDVVLPLTRHSSADVCWVATGCIAEWGRAEATEVLADILQHSRNHKWNTMGLLDSYGDARAIPAVITRLRRIFSRPPTGNYGGKSERVHGLSYLSRHRNVTAADAFLREVRDKKWDRLDPQEQRYLAEGINLFADMPLKPSDE